MSCCGEKHESALMTLYGSTVSFVVTVATAFGVGFRFVLVRISILVVIHTFFLVNTRVSAFLLHVQDPVLC